MTSIRKIVLALVAAFALGFSAPQSAHAAGGFIGDYHIIGIVIFGTGSTTNWAALIFDGEGGGFNTTCDDQRNVLYLDLSTIRGRSMLSTATAAMLAHTAVNAVGTNSCISTAITLPTFWARSETVSWLNVTGQ